MFLFVLLITLFVPSEVQVSCNFVFFPFKRLWTWPHGLIFLMFMYLLVGCLHIKKKSLLVNSEVNVSCKLVTVCFFLVVCMDLSLLMQ